MIRRHALALLLGLGLCFSAGCAAPRVGDACTTSNDCSGELCINDAFTPGGYCSKACDPDAPASKEECPEGSVCVRKGGARSYSSCLRSCDKPEDCRAGYLCEVVEGSVRAVCIGATP